MNKLLELKKTSIFLALLFFINCSNGKVEEQNKPDIEASKQSYIMSSELLSEQYKDVKGATISEGLVPTAEVAVQIAEIIWNEIYGKANIESQKPFTVNLEGDVWIIEGYLEQGWCGGVAYIEISKTNGEVLKVIHTK